VQPEDAETVELARTHGLRGDYYDYLDGWITDIPDVATLPPTFSRIDLALDFDTDESFALPFGADTYAVRWTGFLRVPEDGDYRFTCGSDDGARIKIDGTAVVDYAALRPYGESSGPAKLTAGTHAIEVVFYENYGYASCRLWWDGPGWKRRIVAPEFLTPPAEFANVTPPHIASITPPSGFVEDEVTIRGAGFAGAASRVTFHGVPAEIVSATTDRIVAKVPVGAASGDVVVQAGAISSLPRKFDVRNLLGLYAEYFKFDGELRDYPDFDHLAPFFVRLDPNVDFLEDDLWDLPYDSDVFAARHTGFLYVPADDDYRITLGSDDGARVTLDGKPYLEMPGLHPYAEQSRTTRLAAGFHPIEVIFFENYGAARLALFWQRPSEPTRSVIPAGFFYAPRELSDLPTPAVASVAPKAAEIRGDIEIKGSGFGTNERLVRVVFPGDVWVRPTTVDDDRIRVRVPYGAESGDLFVEVGIQRSNRAAFAVATPIGLTADYLTFNDRASLDAAIADLSVLSKPASFTRTETSWQRPAAKDWALPFAMPTFVVHWHGTLAVEYPADIDWILRTAAGGYLFVDGQLAVDCGPWHELEERYGRSHLTPGEHRFDLWLVQSGAEPRIQLLYTPTGRLEHLPVPARWFQPREKR
jgi:PA14 domain/IPT/TIG domain